MAQPTFKVNLLQPGYTTVLRSWKPRAGQTVIVARVLKAISDLNYEVDQNFGSV